MELAVNNTESVLMTVRGQIERFAQVNVTPAAVIMSQAHYDQLVAEMNCSLVKGNTDSDTVGGLPIIIFGTAYVTVCASPSQLRNAGLL